jgi:hypothetical protein
MLVAMILMATVLRSPLGLLAIAGALWMVALARARAARTSQRARELLADLLVMALVTALPLLHGGGNARGSSTMPGMAGSSLDGRVIALALILGWAVVRVALLRRAARQGRTAESAVSGGCCAVGLAAMLLI